MDELKNNKRMKIKMVGSQSDKINEEIETKSENNDLEEPFLVAKGRETFINEPITDWREGVRCIDQLDGNLVDNVKVDTSDVDFTKEGIYIVHYSVENSRAVKVIHSAPVTVKKKKKLINNIQCFAEYCVPCGIDPYELNKILSQTIVNGKEYAIEIIADYFEEAKINLNSNGEYFLPVKISSLSNTKSIEGLIKLIVGQQKPNLYVQNKKIYGSSDSKKIDWHSKIKAFDSVDGDISTQIKVNRDKVNLAKEGSYPIYYKVTNSSGQSSSLCQWVTIEALSPVLTVSKITLIAGEKVSVREWLKEINATDEIDGNITQNIQVDTSKVDFLKEGQYEVFYEVKNSNNKVSRETSKIEVRAMPPVLKANVFQIEANRHAEKDVNWTVNVEALDKVDMNIQSKITYDLSKVNYLQEGSYPITFKVENSNRKKTEITTKVEVVAKKPILNVVKNVVSASSCKEDIDWLECINAYDLVDGDLTKKVVVDDRLVISNKIGAYPVSYSVENSNGKKVEKELIISVEAEAPVITAENIELEQHTNLATVDWFKLVKALDRVDGDLTDSVTVFYEKVNSHVSGVYEVIYLVRNRNQKQGTKTIAVKIKE